MCECDVGACGEKESVVINIRIDKIVVNYEDGCFYVEHVYMDEEGDEIFLDSEE